MHENSFWFYLLCKEYLFTFTICKSFDKEEKNFHLFIFKDFTFNIEDIYNAQLPGNYGNNHRPSSVTLEKEQLEKFNQMSAFYDKYESILGQVRLIDCCRFLIIRLI